MEVAFSDAALDSLIANGFGKSKREARKTAIKQMVTFLIQKKLIKFGLKDKSFLHKKKEKQTVTTEVERRTLVPEEEKKLKEIKMIYKRMQETLKDGSWEEACNLLRQILEKKDAAWSEVFFLFCRKSYEPGLSVMEPRR